MQVVIATLILGFIGTLVWYFARLFGKAGDLKHKSALAASSAPAPSKSSQKQNRGAVVSNQVKKKLPKQSNFQFQHPCLVTSLKGHSGRILDMSFSENGKFLATCSEDQSVLIWQSKEFPLKEHHFIRTNITYDHASRIRWSPDGKAFLILCAAQNELQVRRLNKNADDGKYSVSVARSFANAHDRTDDIVGMDLATNGKFIMTCAKNKNDMVLYDLKGHVLCRLDTCHMTTYAARISRCGRFVASSGFTPDVKFWEVKFNRSGDFDKVQRAFDLVGHTSGIYHFDFSRDSTKVATISKDGSWKLFNIGVDFQHGQDPTCLKSGSLAISVDAESRVALSGDSRFLAVSYLFDVALYCCSSTSQICKIQQIHSSPISALLFDDKNNWLLTSGDKHVRVFHDLASLAVSAQKN